MKNNRKNRKRKKMDDRRLSKFFYDNVLQHLIPIGMNKIQAEEWNKSITKNTDHDRR